MFKTILIEPLYNALVGLIDIVPGADIGLAVIILTILVKLLLYPLSKSSIVTQIKMKSVEGELKKIKEKFLNNKEEQGKAMLDLYRKNRINPFAGILLIFIQIPVVIALYYVFARSGLPNINTELLYSFITEPSFVKTNFLNFFDLTASKSIILSLLVGLSQYIQMQILTRKNKSKEISKPQTTAEEIMKTMQFQMKYIMPMISIVITFSLVSVVGLYWFVGNIFSILQELYLRKRFKNSQMN